MESKYKKCSSESFKQSYIYEIILNPFKLKTLLYNKYGDIEEDFNLLYLDAILYSKNCHFSVKYREYLIWDYVDEFLKRYYMKKESIERLPKIANYYKNYLKFFCNPFFKDFKINQVIQIYGDDKAKIYYKNNYGPRIKSSNDNNALNENAEEDENPSNEIINGHKNSNKPLEREKSSKSMIFNTTVRGNIENNVITKSSMKSKNEISKNYDSFFESSFSNNNALNFNHLFNNNNDNNSTSSYFKNDINKKSIQESLINLLYNVNSTSFTYDFITEENFNKNKNKEKDNFDIKTSFKSSNKIKSKQPDKGPKRESINLFNYEKKNESNKLDNKNTENKISQKIKVKQDDKILNQKPHNPNTYKSNNPNFQVCNNANNIDNNLKKLNTENFCYDMNNKDKIKPCINTQKSNMNCFNPNLFNVNLRNSPNELKLNLNYKHQINAQSKIFKKMYKDIIKESTNKLVEKQNIINNLNKNIHNDVNTKSRYQLDKELDKKEKVKLSDGIVQTHNNNNFPMGNTNFLSNDKEKMKQSTKEKDIITKNININPTLKHERSEKSYKENQFMSKAKSISSDTHKNNLLNLKTSTNNFNIDGCNNLVINISPRLNMNINEFQDLNNLENKLDISPEKLLYNISNRVGSPIMNSIVNINIKPIVQMNNNIIENRKGSQTASLKADMSKNSENRIQNQDQKPINKNNIINDIDQNCIQNKNLIQPNFISTNNNNRNNNIINNNTNLIKTKYSEFKKNNLNNKPSRFSSMSNNSNKIKDISRKQSNYTNTNINENPNNLMNNTNASKNGLQSLHNTLKTSQNQIFIHHNFPNNVSCTNHILKMIKLNFESEKGNKMKTKSFDHSNSQGNLFNFNNPTIQTGAKLKNLNFNDSYRSKNEFVQEKMPQNSQPLSRENKIEIKKLISSNINSSKIINNKKNDVINKKLINSTNPNIPLQKENKYSPNKSSNSLHQSNKELFYSYPRKNDIKLSDDNLNLLECPRVASAELKNDVYTLRNYDKDCYSQDNHKREDYRSVNNQLLTKEYHVLNLNSNVENNLKDKNKIMYNNNLGNISNVQENNKQNKTLNLNYLQYLNNYKSISSDANLSNLRINSPIVNDKISSISRPNSSLVPNQGKSNNNVEKIKHENKINFCLDNKMNLHSNPINSDLILNLISQGNKNINFQEIMNSGKNVFHNLNFQSHENQMNNDIVNNSLTRKNIIRKNSLKSKINENTNANPNTKMNSNRLYELNSISNSINLISTLHKNNKSSKLQQNVRLSPFIFDSSLREKSGSVNHNNSNNNHNPNDNIDLIINGNKNNSNSTKLNNYLFNSNNLISHAQKNGHLITNASSSMNNKISLNTNKISNSLQMNKNDFNFNNFNTIKILNNISKQGNNQFLNNLNKVNSNLNSTSNKKTINLEKNSLQRKKISILKNKQHPNFKIDQDNFTNRVSVNFSSSPYKNKNDTLKSPHHHHIINIKGNPISNQSRNINNSLYKVNTNPSNTSKMKDGSELKANLPNQGSIHNEGNPNILNMRLFEFMKNQDYVDLLKDTIEYNLSTNQNIKNNTNKIKKKNDIENSKISKGSSWIHNNVNINQEKADNNCNLNQYKDKISFNQNDSTLKPNPSNNHLGSELQNLKEENKKHQLKFKTELSKANNFINNKISNTAKNNNNNSILKKKIANSNNDVWVNNPYIIKSNNLGSQNKNNLKFNNIAKNKSIDSNMFFQLTHNVNKISSLSKSKKKEK